MRNKYKEDFVKKLREAFSKTFGPDNVMSESLAGEYFETFITGLYDKKIPGLSNGYGHYSEEVRQQMVEAFSLQTSALIKSLGDVAAQGSTFLWSNQNIGMFAAAEQAIREAAGVLSSGQSLGQTLLGKLWGELEVLKLSVHEAQNKAMGLTWDNTSQAWNAISKEFAANAEGDVHVFLPKDIGALSIFWNVELPELRKRMEPFMNPPKVTEITLHSPNNETLRKLQDIDKDTTLIEEQKKEKRRELMTIPNNWESKKIQDASIEIPEIQLTEAQKAEIKNVLENSPNPRNAAVLEILNERNTRVKSITLNKLQNIGERWRIKTLYKQLEKKQPASQKKIVKNIVQYLNKNPNILSRSRRPSSRPHQNSSRPPHKSLSN